jgi:L-asparaginase II
MKGAPVGNYLDPAHPVQQEILANFAAFCDLPVDEIDLGMDGCSAPVFAVPMGKAALAMARLVDPAYTPSGMHFACQTVIQAMQAYPEMIAGPGRFDTRLTQCGNNRWIMKAGAEGYQILGILPGALSPGSPGVGIAIKVSDGDLMRPTPATDAAVEDLASPKANPGGRGIPLVTLEVLRQLQALTAECQEELKSFDRRPVYNWQKLPVGEIRPCFTLERYA